MLTSLPELISNARSHLRCLDAKTAIMEMQKNGGTMLDVREPAELTDLPAPHSLNVPRGILEMKVMDAIPDATHPIYVHCATGGRATLAAEQLERLGYTQVAVVTCAADIVQKQQEALTV